MKIVSMTLCLLASLTGMAQQEQPFTLSGTVEGLDSGYLTLVATDMYEYKMVDTAVIRAGNFEFHGFIPHPVMAFISEGTSLKPADDPNSVSFFLDPGTIHAVLPSGNFKNLTLTGARTQTDMDAFKGNMDLEYMTNHPDSYASVYLLRSKMAQLSPEMQEKYFNALSPAVQQSGFGKYIESTIHTSRLGQPGVKAPDFTSTDINGQPLSLRDFKGKYVLLDFWASWCIPCRKSNPHLLELYSKYKEKGFEIIGVSDDDTKPDAWRNAVEKDGIGVWKHVLRGLDMDKVHAGDINFSHHTKEISSSRYGITVLPTKILIDPAGTIIGRYSSENESELDKKLAFLF